MKTYIPGLLILTRPLHWQELVLLRLPRGHFPRYKVLLSYWHLDYHRCCRYFDGALFIFCRCHCRGIGQTAHALGIIILDGMFILLTSSCFWHCASVCTYSLATVLVDGHDIGCMTEFSFGVWGFIFYDDEQTGSRHTVVAAVLGCDLHRIFHCCLNLILTQSFGFSEERIDTRVEIFTFFSVSNPFVSGLVFS